jgi:hypothetical protein
MKTFLIALPIFRGEKGFCHPTILVNAKDECDAIHLVFHLKGKHVHIGDIKEVEYK